LVHADAFFLCINGKRTVQTLRKDQGSERPGVRYDEHVSTYHSFYGTADVRKVSFNVFQKDCNMVDPLVSACVVECDGGKEAIPMWASFLVSTYLLAGGLFLMYI
jgi:hypothetical protein